MAQGDVISGERRVSQAAFRNRSARAAAGLHDLGVQAGDTVALFLRNDIAFLEASVAAGLLGAHPVALNWHWTENEAAYVFADCGAKVVIIHRDLLPAMRGAIPADALVIEVETPPELIAAYGLSSPLPPSPQTLAWDAWLARQEPLAAPLSAPPGAMIYTSGTTGHPKGVRRFPPDAGQAAAAAQMAAAIYGLDGSDAAPVALVTAPMYHSAPNAMGMNALRAGATVVLQPKFDAEETLRLIERWGVTHAYFAPIMFNRLLQLPEAVRRRYDLSSLRFAVHAAAPCPPEIKRAMIGWWGPVIHEFYGSTEARAVTACSSAEWLEHPGTVGKLLPGAVVRVVDDTGRDVPVGEPGEIVCGNPGFADFTYHNDNAKRRAADRDGLFAIGDVGYFDEAGYLYVCDRSSDMIISGGVNIYPAEIEAELARLPGVRDCAVIGVPDPEYGEAVMAIVEPLDGATLDPNALRSRLRERLAGYKVPRLIEQRSHLPREDSGKIMKRKLREPYWQGAQRRI